MNINENYLTEINKILKNSTEIEQFIEHCQKPLKKSIKINLSRILPEDFINLTKQWWWNLTDPWFVGDDKFPIDSFYIDRENLDTPLGKTFLHLSWFFYIQEIAASMPARFLDIKDWDIILDISAAPGWKSAQISDYLSYLWKNPWFLVSNEINGKRLQSLAHNLNRMWAFNAWITKFNWFVFGKNLWEVFDSVLVDAPCSWEWTWYKSDFSLRTWKKQEINRICGTQFQLLVSAIKSVKAGWNVVYSTCTMNPYENEENVSKILDFFQWAIELEDINIYWKSSGITSIEENGEEKQLLSNLEANKLARFRPHIQKTWWFFVAKFKKIKSLSDRYPVKQSRIYPQNPFKMDMSKSFQNWVASYIKDNLGIDIDFDKYFFVGTKNKVYITSCKFLEIKDIIQFEKVWIPILKFSWQNKLVPLHWLWVVLGDLAQKNFVCLDYEQMQKYSSLKDIPLSWIKGDFTDREYVIVKYKNWWMSVWKIIDWFLKNKYIKV